MTFIDLFAGIGGFRLGLEKSGEHIQKERSSRRGIRPQGDSPISDTGQKGWQGNNAYHCVWSNEWDKYCAKIYQKNFKEAPDTRNIRTVPSGEIPNHDLLCAGFPCQSFSVAGKRAGFDDTRGTLFFEIARILRDKRPRYFLLENVKGLLSHETGKTFQTILGILANLGYRCEWQVLNSKNFGVPQNRERVFIIGHFTGESGFQVFPIRENGERTDKTLGNISTGKCSETVSTRTGSTARGQQFIMIHHKRQAGELRIQDKPCVTKHYGTGGGNVPLIANAVDCDGYLRQMGVHHDKPICHYRIRRLTPIECERLQGFPDNWTKGVSDTQRYKMLGNAVTVNVVQAIGERIRGNRPVV